MRSWLPLCVAAGLVAAQLSLALVPDMGVSAALGSGLRVMLACWALLTLAEVGSAMVRGAPAAPVGAKQMGHGAGARPQEGVAAGPDFPLVQRPRPSALHVALGGAALIAAALQRAPARLLANLLGYSLIAVPLCWVVQRRAGPVAAAKAAAVLALFALVPTHADLPRPPVLEAWRFDSPFRWTVGWPADGWVLRHEIQLDRALEARPMTLTIPLAGSYDGPAQVLATLNGHDLGYARLVDRQALKVEIPAPVLAGRSRLTFELREHPLDPSLRLLAQRWVGGATLGPAASSFYDTHQWWSGTFNDATGRRQAGMYIVRLEEGP